PISQQFGDPQELVKASELKDLQKAESDVQAAEARVNAIKNADTIGLGSAAMQGATDTAIELVIDDDLNAQMAELNERAEKLSAIKFPSKAQATELADIREQQVALANRMRDEYNRTVSRLEANAKAEAERQEASRKEESAELARNSSDSVDTIVVGGAKMTRDEFVQKFSERLMKQNPNLTREDALAQADARYNELAAQTPKTEQKTEDKEEHKSKVKPEKREPIHRAKLTGKVEYWQGGAVPGAGRTEYAAVTEAEAEELLGKTELDFVKNVLTKVANVTLIRSVNGVGANGIFFKDGRLYLDVNAHAELGQRSIVLTAAHELTHFIRAYNNNNIDGDTVAPRLVVSTVVQNTEDAVGYILRDIEIVPISQGLSGAMTGASQPTNRNINTVAELYDFVKALPRSDGGLLYTDAQRAEYSFPYTERNDGVAYSTRDTNAPDSDNPYPPNTLQHDMLEHARKGDLYQWLREQKNAYDESLENAKERPPVIPAKGFVPKVTEKEKQAIEKRRQYLIQKNGALKPSEKDATGYAMPKADENARGFNRFLQNVLTAKQTTPAHEQAKKFAFIDVAATHVVDSNKADIKWATDVIKEDGKESAMKQFNRAAIAMDNSQHNITKSLALGQQLLIQTSREGDMQGFLDVLSSLALLSSQAGKSLQAFRMLKQSGPIGELYYVEKAVKQLNERNAAKIQAGKMGEITIPEDFANEVLMATTEEEQDAAVDNLIKEIGKQVPVTLMDKWNAWRYLAMLGNARTHIRNIIGNAVFVPLRFAKDLMAAGGEFVLTKTGVMNEQDRRKALFVSKELKDFAKQDALTMQKELQGNGKYNPMREILDARQILPGFLETLSRKNGQALEFEDWLFLSPAYQSALAQALTHSGYSIEEMLDGSNKDAAKALNRARVLAVEEAQKATYRDFSATAAMLNRIKRLEGKSKFTGVLIEGILPFTKTPINILKRGIEYSPIGVASSIFEAAAKVKSGEFDMAEFIDHLSAGLTGTAVVALGYLLSSLGYIRGKKDDKEEEFDKLQGYQDYSLQIGDVSATIDWAAPTALPLFTGAALYDFTHNDQEFEWKDAWDAMMMIAEPMLSLSMLDGLNNVLSSASYADDSRKLPTIGASALTSYLGQAFPTIAGQLARSIDGTRRSTYVDKNSPVPSAIQRFVQSSVQSKTPGWESQKIPYIDQWGREDTVNSKALGALENFFSPSYINLVHTTDVDEALRELYDATKDSSVLPARVQNRVVKVNGEDRYFTADQFVDISKYVGTTKYTMLTQLFSDPRYMRLTDEQTAKAVAKVYDYANTTGKYYIWNDYNLHGQGKWMEEMYDMPTDIQRFNRFWEYLESYLKLD
ncbi:MAG: hypothetical protein IKD61_02830, partial [Oscillospiraceae bacterium]|nr:hypothetical protein [Oscillospiraceae bacterium]